MDLKNYLIIIEEAKDGTFSAYSPDVNGCIATGETSDMARKNFLSALKFHIEGLVEEGLEVPEPTCKAAFCAEDCSGILNVRVSKSLHYELIRRAQMEGVSVSHLVNDALVEKYSKKSEPEISYTQTGAEEFCVRYKDWLNRVPTSIGWLTPQDKKTGSSVLWNVSTGSYTPCSITSYTLPSYVADTQSKKTSAKRSKKIV